MSQRVRVVGDGYTVELRGDTIDRADLRIDMEMPGVAKTSRSSSGSLLGEKSYLNLSWSVNVERERRLGRDVAPEDRFKDPFPRDMPETIANATIYGREERTSGMSPELPLEYMYIDHFYVQEPARRMGYGSLMWDAYLALLAWGDYDARGKVGSSADRETVEFVASKGVPRSDIEYSDSSAWLGEGSVYWETDGQNVLDAAANRIER